MRMTLIITPVIALAGMAAAQPAPGSMLGADRATVATSLKSHGLQLTGFHKKRGVIEAEARGNSGRIEVRIDARTGKLLRSEMEDEQ